MTILTVFVALFCIASNVVMAGGPAFGAIREFNFEFDFSAPDSTTSTTTTVDPGILLPEAATDPVLTQEAATEPILTQEAATDVILPTDFSTVAPEAAVEITTIAGMVAERALIRATTTTEPESRIRCCQIANGTIGFSSAQRFCGNCDGRNEFVFVDSSNSDQICCMKNNGISKPDECVYSISGKPDPNENRGSCWDVDGTVASCPNHQKLYWFSHGYCCCDGGEGGPTYGGGYGDGEEYERPHHYQRKRRAYV